MPFHFVSGDLTQISADAIVNAANSRLAPGGGVCGAIFEAAGYARLDQACRKIGRCETGDAVLTDAFALPARFVIHTVGPVWQGGSRHEPELLASCYRNSLRLAKQHGCASIAFPLISAGIYGYPKEKALQIAVSAIRGFLEENEIDVSLVLFGQGAVVIDSGLYQRIQAFLADFRVDDDKLLRELPFGIQSLAEDAAQPVSAGSRAETLETLEEPFSVIFQRMIERKGLADADICARANIGSALLAKLREPGYTPARQTALALAAALRLGLEETGNLLRHAGYALSRGSRGDGIFEYFIREGLYDIFEINAALFSFGQRQLGA